jgi:hypothetical protein
VIVNRKLSKTKNENFQKRASMSDRRTTQRMEDVTITEKSIGVATAAAQASPTQAYPQVWLTSRCAPCASCWKSSSHIFVSTLVGTVGVPKCSTGVPKVFP